MLGGSSALNTQVFTPQSKVGVDGWGKLGNPGWNWEIMAPYYKKFHTLIVPPDDLAEDLDLDWVEHSVKGKSGPIQASFTGDNGEGLVKMWTETFSNLGYPLQGSPFTGKTVGAFHNPVSIHPETKERSHAANAYYSPASDRSNLHVLTGALVTNIIFNGNNDQVIATGVSYSKTGNDHVALAKKEVILAAGSVQSPKLLELSGIGSGELLQSHNIKVYVDNPYVGENLQDHPMTGISFEVNDNVPTLDSILRQEPEPFKVAFEQYKINKNGPLCSAGVTLYAYKPVIEFSAGHGVGVLRKLLEKYSPDPMNLAYPAEQLFYEYTRSVLEDPKEGSASVFATRVQHSFGNTTSAKGLVGDLLPENYFSLVSFLLYPLSRGNVHIASRDPAVKPVINPNYLAHPLDREIFARHLQDLEKIAATQPLVSILKPGGKRNSPKARVKDLKKAKEYLSLSVISGWHLTGTCTMMPQDKGGVVNARLLTYGTKNLRIVDASIMPIVPGGNPQTSVYAIAERAADFIKEDHGLSVAK